MLRLHPKLFVFTRISRDAFIQENDLHHARFVGGYCTGKSGLTPEQTGECYDKLSQMDNLMYFGDEHHWVDEYDRSKCSKALTVLGIGGGYMTRADEECKLDKFIKKKKGFFIISDVRVDRKKGDIRVIYYHLNIPNQPNHMLYDRPTLERDAYELYTQSAVTVKRIAKINSLCGEDVKDDTDIDSDKVFKWVPLRDKNELAGWTKCAYSYSTVTSIYAYVA